MNKLVVLIPCYNEAESIAMVLSKFPREDLKKYGLSLEVIVIDNNSTDNTAQVARDNGATVLFEPQKGKGNAIRTGFTNLPSNTDYVAMIDGDDTYAPTEILRMVEPLHSGFCQTVIGSRLGGKVGAGSMNFISRAGNWFFTHLVRYTYNVAVTDVLTGYFAWTKDSIDKLAPHLKSEGFAIEMEMIIKTAKLKQQIYSVPISYHPRIGSSNLKPFSDGRKILAMYFKGMLWKPETMQD